MKFTIYLSTMYHGNIRPKEKNIIVWVQIKQNALICLFSNVMFFLNFSISTCYRLNGAFNNAFYSCLSSLPSSFPSFLAPFFFPFSLFFIKVFLWKIPCHCPFCLFNFQIYIFLIQSSWNQCQACWLSWITYPTTVQSHDQLVVWICKRWLTTQNQRHTLLSSVKMIFSWELRYQFNQLSGAKKNYNVKCTYQP